GRALPAAGHRVDREHLYGGESFDLTARTEVVTRDDALARRRVENLEVFPRHGARVMTIDDSIDDSYWWLRENRGRRHDDLEMSGIELAREQEGLALPRGVHVAEVALDERHRRGARSGVEQAH